MSHSQVDINAMADKAWGLVEGKQLHEARTVFEQICEIDNHNAEAWMMLGSISGEFGETEKALSFLYKAIEIDPEYADPYLNAAKIMHALNRHEEALHYCQKTVNCDPEYAEAWLFLSFLAGLMKRYDIAESASRKSIQLQPDKAEFFVTLGNALLPQGKINEGVCAFEKAVELDPNLRDVWLTLGKLQAQSGKLSDAERCYRKLLALDPRNAGGLNRLGGVLLQMNRLTEAEESCLAALKINEHFAEAYANLGNVLQSKGQLTKAIERYKQAIACQPDFVGAYINLGQTFRQLKEFDQSVAAYTEALRLSSGFAEIHMDLGELFLEKKAFAEAEKHYQSALRLKPAHPGSLLGMAQISRIKREYVQALNYCASVLRIQPDLAVAHYQLGLCQKFLGQFDDAADSFRMALKLNTDDLDVQASLSILELMRGNLLDGWGYYFSRSSMRLNSTSQPKPLPTDLDGRKIVLMKDQGIGDEIFFLRFVRLLKERGAIISYRTDPKIASLVSRMPFIDIVLTEDPFFEKDMLLWSVGDLPYLLGLNDFSRTPHPLSLTPTDLKLSEVRKKLDGLGNGPYIGITWWAGTKPPAPGFNDGVPYREIPLDLLAHALQGCDGNILILQRNPDKEDVSQLEKMIGKAVHDFSYLNDDIEGMLALLSLLDDYIGVDNTNMHLSASVGKPCRIMVPHPPEWRSMASGKSPWFPGFVMYRQSETGDWSRAFEALATDLN